MILNKWAAWPKPLIAQLDWQASTLETAAHSLGDKATSRSSQSGQRPADAFGLFNSSPHNAGQSAKGFFDLDSFTSGHRESLDTQMDLFTQVTQNSSHEDVFASLIPSSSSPALTQSQVIAAAPPATESPALLSSRILETLLYHALVHVKDGWVHWRDTLMFLRSTALDAAIPEEQFRTARRDLFVGLLQRLSQSASNDFYMSTGAVTEQLRGNLAHIIDIMEEILYFAYDEAKKAKHIRVDEVDLSTRLPKPNADDAVDASGLTLSMPTSSSPEPSLSRSTDDGEKTDSWMVVTEEDTTDILGSAQSSLPTSPSALAASPSFSSAASGASVASSDQLRGMRHEWVLVSELLQCVISLSFSLTPHRPLSNRPESNSFFDALKSSGDEPQPVRAGGPLRVVLRFLLDCIASVVLNAQLDSTSPDAGAEQRPSPVKQLERMLASLSTICTRDLSPQPSPAAQRKDADKGAERTWKNRYGLVVLYRLSSITRASPDSLRPTLLAGCRQLVDVLQPFSMVSALNFTAGRENSDGQDRVIYVPVMVSPAGQLDISPSFNFQLSSSAAEIPGAATPSSLATSSSFSGGAGGGGGMSADLLAAHRRVQESMNSGAPTRSDDDVFFGAGSGAPASSSSPVSPRSIGSMYPSSFIEPHASPSYSKVLRGCMDYVHSCAKLVSTAEARYAAEYNVLTEKTRHYVVARLRTEREGWRRLGDDLLRAAARVLQSHQYTEANRKAVVDALAREQQREVAEMWRSFQWSLFVEGSAWIPGSMIGKRRFWQIDPIEQHENRMRRKLKQFHDGTDLRQASQTYFLELERQKQLKASKLSTPAVVKKRKTVGVADAGKALQLSAAAGAEGDGAADDKKEVDGEAKGAGPGIGESIEVLEAEALQDGGEEDLEAMRSLVSNLGDQLHLNLKVGGAQEERDAADVEYEDGAEGEEAAAAGADTQSPTPSVEEETGAEAEGKEEATVSEADWDLCADSPDLNRPVLSNNPNSYTSLNVMLVLPFTTVMGSLEMGSRYLQFVPNLNAEMTDRNGNAILEKVAVDHRLVLASTSTAVRAAHRCPPVLCLGSCRVEMVVVCGRCLDLTPSVSVPRRLANGS